MPKSKESTLVDFTPPVDASSEMELGQKSMQGFAASTVSPGDFDLGHVETAAETGLDAFLASNPEVLKPLKMASRKVASLGDLSNFIRLSSETLVHKSDRDLWAIKKEADGLVIERLFDDDGKPLKG